MGKSGEEQVWFISAHDSAMGVAHFFNTSLQNSASETSCFTVVVVVVVTVVSPVPPPPPPPPVLEPPPHACKVTAIPKTTATSAADFIL
mmetsp:Transcript_35599/g.63297  ORF Transcript_35599/g.63297 Transcript_35599/m.63297 type:complete len:89 (+) Transcript_35599:579-845(+)